MAFNEHLSLADVKNRLSEVVDKLEREHGRVVVTEYGRPAAVLLNIEDLESLEKTLELLSNPDLLGSIHEAEADVAAGRAERLSRDQALARVAKRDPEPFEIAGAAGASPSAPSGDGGHDPGQD